MTKITIDASKLGIPDFQIKRGLGNQQKVGEFQEKVAKFQMDAKAKMVKLSRDGRLLDALDKNKSEDQRTMERLSKEYDADLGPFSIDLWDIYKAAIGMTIENELEPISDPSSAVMLLKRAKLSFAFIEEMAGITTKKTKEKFENNDDLTIDDLNTVTNQIVQAVMGVEDQEPTEQDKKSNS